LVFVTGLSLVTQIHAQVDSYDKFVTGYGYMKPVGRPASETSAVSTLTEEAAPAASTKGAETYSGIPMGLSAVFVGLLTAATAFGYVVRRVFQGQEGSAISEPLDVHANTMELGGALNSQARSFGWGQSASPAARTVTARYATAEDMPLGIGPETGNVMFDPLGFGALASPTTMKWFRAAELKHGRVSMLATLGWVWQSNGGGFIPFHDGAGGLSTLSTRPLEANAQLWNLASGIGFIQIIATAGIIEVLTESTGTHYMSPEGDGYMDLFRMKNRENTLPLKSDLTTLQTQELKNGRLAMIGIASFFAAEFIPGSVPGYPYA